MRLASASLDAEPLPKTTAELVPVIYHEYLDVFNKEAADELPLHRPYDHSIPLVEGAKIPAGRLTPHNEAELEELRKYIEENLKKSFIRPSSSPAGAPVLFVKKKDGSLRLV